MAARKRLPSRRVKVGSTEPPDEPPEIGTVYISEVALKAILVEFAARQIGVKPPYMHRIEVNGAMYLRDRDNVFAVKFLRAPKNVIPFSKFRKKIKR